MRCKFCSKIVRHPTNKTKTLQICGSCQKNNAHFFNIQNLRKLENSGPEVM